MWNNIRTLSDMPAKLFKYFFVFVKVDADTIWNEAHSANAARMVSALVMKINLKITSNLKICLHFDKCIYSLTEMHSVVCN